MTTKASRAYDTHRSSRTYGGVNPMPSKASRAAAEEIKKYIYENGVITLGNFHLEKIAEIIEKHTGGPPEHITEALNSGDGVYRP